MPFLFLVLHPGQKDTSQCNRPACWKTYKLLSNLPYEAIHPISVLLAAMLMWALHLYSLLLRCQRFFNVSNQSKGEHSPHQRPGLLANVTSSGRVPMRSTGWVEHSQSSSPAWFINQFMRFHFYLWLCWSMTLYSNGQQTSEVSLMFLKFCLFQSFNQPKIELRCVKVETKL